jgi:plastocyanin
MLCVGSSVAYAEGQNIWVPETDVVKPVADAKGEVLELLGPHGQMLRETLGPAGKVIDTGECARTSRYEVRPQGNYGPECRRLQIMFGPILSKPGQDDVLIQPVTFEKPMYDGYITRFEPGLVTEEGFTPPVEEMHLHHGTWLNTGYFGSGRSYGEGPWIASGEEKTIVTWPKGYGLKIQADDQWLFLHMIHQATFTEQTRPVFVYYNIDYIATEDAEAAGGMTNTRGVWLDGGGANFHDDTETYSLNPIFNAQRGFGSGGECRFPIQNCAAFNSNGNTSAQQGMDVSSDVEEWADRDNVPGYVKTISTSTLGGANEGTLVVMGGHTHNGGIGTEVELLRQIDGVWQSRLIQFSEAYYWQDDNPLTAEDESERIGNQPLSWDYSQTGSTLDHGWAVNVKAGDKLRLSGVYDTAVASTYEQMSIVMTWVTTGTIAEGKELFDSAAPNYATLHPGIPVDAVVPLDATGVPLVADCPGRDAGVLCQRGQITHGQIPSSGNHSINSNVPDADSDGVREGFGETAFDWTAVPDGQHLNDVPIGGFTYGPADFAVTPAAGVPYVTLGESITFHNIDTADYMWHTLTRCAQPCNGPTTVDYPLANAGGNLVEVDGYLHDPMDFDSTQIGIGLGPTQRTSWTFTPTETGTFSFFCRIHPSMRGVFRVK